MDSNAKLQNDNEIFREMSLEITPNYFGSSNVYNSQVSSCNTDCNTHQEFQQLRHLGYFNLEKMDGSLNIKGLLELVDDISSDAKTASSGPTKGVCDIEAKHKIVARMTFSCIVFASCYPNPLILPKTD